MNEEGNDTRPVSETMLMN